MRIISLNTWGGKVYDPMIKFVEHEGHKTDVFCFQEVFSSPDTSLRIREGACAQLFERLQLALPEHDGFFAPAQANVDPVGYYPGNFSYGLALFVKRALPKEYFGDTFVYGYRDALRDHKDWTMPRNVQHVLVNGVHVYNFHGMWTGGGKEDTPERIVQSEKILAKLREDKGHQVLIGDFNLAPDTKSLALLEGRLTNLVRKYGITSTRSHLYTKSMKFADYALVTPDLRVRSFRTMEPVVSDHLALELIFD